MNKVEDLLVQNMDKIEKIMEIMGETSEVLAATVGKLHPVLETVFEVIAKLLKNPEGIEAQHLTKQFDLVNQKLHEIQDEADEISREQLRSFMNMDNFKREQQILNQYNKFKEFLEASDQYKHINKERFLKYYVNTREDKDLKDLYKAVTEKDDSGKTMLDTVACIEKRSRRVVENFCVHLKKLFVMGIVAALGYTVLTTGEEEELNKLLNVWQERMKDVEKQMKATVDDCAENFAEQAKEDVKNQLQEKPGSVDPDFTKSLLDSLVKKYDWVNWSIRVFNDKERIFFFNWLAGKKYHGSGGGEDHYFDLLTMNKIKVVISFCVNPKPINTSQIQEEIERQKMMRNMRDVAQSLSKRFPRCLVHAVSHFKEVVETNNFPEDCYYYGKHKGAYLHIHSI